MKPARRSASCARRWAGWALSAGLALTMPWPEARAGSILPDPQQAFAEAAQAYDDGDYDLARERYEQMLKAGYGGKELHFNLGNAWFRLGKPGRAVAHYRRAWRDAPRDPDIRTNLAHAQRQAGSILTTAPLIQSVWSYFSPSEWAILATASWWAALLLLGASFHVRKHRAGLRKAAAWSAVLLVVSAPGVQYWRGSITTREAVVVESGHQAKFAPLEGAQSHFETPEATLVRVREDAEGWYRVSLNEKSGWLPKSACIMVLGEESPWGMRHN